MKDEHCEMAGCNESFITSNYGVETTPRAEYEIATGQRECSPGDMKDKKGRRVRVIRNLEELKLLRVVQDAEIGEEEIVAVVRHFEAALVASLIPDDCVACVRAHAHSSYFSPMIPPSFPLTRPSCRFSTLGPCSRSPIKRHLVLTPRHPAVSLPAPPPSPRALQRMRTC